MLSKNKHHIQKEHVPIRWGMKFSGNLSVFSRKIITTICDKIKGIFVWNGSRLLIANLKPKFESAIRKTILDQLFLIAVFEVGLGISDLDNLQIHSNQVACCILAENRYYSVLWFWSATLHPPFWIPNFEISWSHNQGSQKSASTKFHLSRVTFRIWCIRQNLAFWILSLDG